MVQLEQVHMPKKNNENLKHYYMKPQSLSCFKVGISCCCLGPIRPNTTFMSLNIRQITGRFMVAMDTDIWHSVNVQKNDQDGSTDCVWVWWHMKRCSCNSLIVWKKRRTTCTLALVLFLTMSVYEYLNFTSTKMTKLFYVCHGNRHVIAMGEWGHPLPL